MLAPKKLKRRKQHRPNVKGVATSNVKIAFGKFALKAITGGWIKAKQIESARRAITGHVQRGAEVHIRIFPDKPITAKGNEICGTRDLRRGRESHAAIKRRVCAGRFGGAASERACKETGD